MKILISDPIAKEGIEALQACADIEVDINIGLSHNKLMSIINNYDALVVRSETKVTADIIEAGTKLQVIGRAGVGVDNIDLDAATRRGIVVVNAPAGNTISTAEHTIALMLAMARNIPQSCASLKSGQWKRAEFTGVEVRNKIVGIIGLGRIGSEVAKRAQGLEMKVIVYDPYISPDHARNLNVSLVTFEQLLRESDFISVHTTLTKGTNGLIGTKELTMVKPTVRFINAARGGIIDEKALFRAVEEGRIAGAAIDVFTEEPAVNNILVDCTKIIVTPHLGASTNEAQIGVAVVVADQVLSVLMGLPVKYAVNTPHIPAETLSMLSPYFDVASRVGKVALQISDGQFEKIVVKYNGDIANYDTSPLKAIIIKTLLESISDENVNIINASLIAQARGLRIIEEKDTNCENYGNLIAIELTTNKGVTKVGGTLMRGQPHIVLVNDFWFDIVAVSGCWLFSDHRDRPGLIGRVSSILGDADINISSMQLGRLTPRGPALMVLELDECIPEEIRKLLLDVPDIYNAKVVTL